MKPTVLGRWVNIGSDIVWLPNIFFLLRLGSS
jgi:hypothetical protein